MKKALLCVSFGTSVPAARKAIAAVEETLREAAADRFFVRAFTSSVIRRILAERGEMVPSVNEALEGLREAGYTDVLIQPTHILYGNEYEKIVLEVQFCAAWFSSLHIGKPLVADTGDLRKLAEIVSKACPAHEGEAQVLFGHGTSHFSNVVYPALQTAFQLTGRADVLVGTVEGWPEFKDVTAQLHQKKYVAVHLVPLMLVAGDHAMNDMAGGDADSWKSRLETEGFSVRCAIQGLGLLPGIRQMYQAHLKEML